MAKLTEAQETAAILWCEKYGCCLRLAALLAVGESVNDVRGCNGCPVSDEQRNQTAIGELAEALKVS